MISSAKSKASVPPASRTPISRTNPNKMECLYQYAIEHGLDPKKFSKKRWDRECFRTVLKNDMQFYHEAVERS